MSGEQDRFESHINNVVYWRNLIRDGQQELEQNQKSLYAAYFRHRDDMFDIIGEGGPLYGEGIVEYAEGLVRMDGSSPGEASAYADELAKVFAPITQEAQPLFFDLHGQRIFTVSGGESYEAQVLHKNTRFGDVNRLDLSTPNDPLLVNGQYSALHGRGSNYRANVWTSPSSVSTNIDVRSLTVIDDPEQADENIENGVRRSYIYVGAAAVGALKKYLSWQDKPHVDAVSRLVEAQGVSLGEVELIGEGGSNLSRPFSRATDTRQQILEFATDYVATVAPWHRWNEDLRLAGVPALLHLDAVKDIVSAEELRDATTNGVIETAQIITDQHKAVLAEWLEKGTPVRLGRFVSSATKQYADSAAERLAQIDGAELLKLDVGRVVELVKSDRNIFRKVTLPPGRPSEASSVKDPVDAALRKYAKNGSFKKKP